jgi:hypothetical protein
MAIALTKASRHHTPTEAVSNALRGVLLSKSAVAPKGVQSSRSPYLKQPSIPRSISVEKRTDKCVAIRAYDGMHQERRCSQNMQRYQ